MVTFMFSIRNIGQVSVRIADSQLDLNPTEAYNYTETKMINVCPLANLTARDVESDALPLPYGTMVNVTADPVNDEDENTEEIGCQFDAMYNFTIGLPHTPAPSVSQVPSAAPSQIPSSSSAPSQFPSISFVPTNCYGLTQEMVEAGLSHAGQLTNYGLPLPDERVLEEKAGKNMLRGRA